MPYTERFEVDEHKRLGAVVHVAGQSIKSKREIAIRNGVGSKKLATIRLLAEQAAVIGWHVEFVRPLINDSKQRLQPVIEFGRASLVVLAELIRRFIQHRAASVGDFVL